MSIRKKKTCMACGEEIPRNSKQDRCDACIAQAADKKEHIIKGTMMAAITAAAAIAGKAALNFLKR